MEKLLAKELDFILEPTYQKIGKTITKITKEIIKLTDNKYSDIINSRVELGHFVFFNRMSDLKEYCHSNKFNIKKVEDPKISKKCETAMQQVAIYDEQITKLYQKLSLEFIMKIKDELPLVDRNYLDDHKKIDLNKLTCHKLFFSRKKTQLIDGLIMCFSIENEQKLNDKATSLNEIETIFNNREKCLEILDIKTDNIRAFPRENLETIFNYIYKYNKKYENEIEDLNIDEEKIISNFLLNDEMLKNSKNTSIPKDFLNNLKKNKEQINIINNEIIEQIRTIKEPKAVWTLEDQPIDNNMLFLLFSPTMNFTNNDFLLVRQICALAFTPIDSKIKLVNSKNIIFGNEKYTMFNKALIDLIAYEITKNLNKDTIINYKKNTQSTNLISGIFLVDEFYKKYKTTIIESLINNDISLIYNIIGKSNFENYINIINRYFYDCHGNLLSKRARDKEVFITAIKNILKISLENMEQYQKILINKDKYTIKENID